jgi:hypothetical protein
MTLARSRFLSLGVAPVLTALLATSTTTLTTLTATSNAFAAPKTGRPAAAETKKSAASTTAAPPVTPPLSGSLTGAAKVDYDSAKLLYGDQDYATAAVKFRRAYDASGDPRLLWNVAACEKALRHYTKSLALVEKYKMLGGALLNDKDRAEADALANALRATTDTLTLTVDLAGADVALDDENVATTPLDHPIRVDLGDHKLAVTKPGFTPFTKTISFTGGAGGGVTLQVALSEVTHDGHLRVEADPDASIVVDNTSTATDAASNGSYVSKLPSGVHALRVTAKGKRTYQGDVVIQDGQTTTVHVHLNDEASGGTPAWVWVTGGAVLVAGGIVATYFAIHGSKSDTTGDGTAGTLGKINLSSIRFGN